MFVSTKRNRGHTHTFTPRGGARKKAPVADESGAASDCGRDAGARSGGLEKGPTARGESQPGVPRAEALSRRTAEHESTFLPVRVADEQRGEAVNGSGF